MRNKKNIIWSAATVLCLGSISANLCFAGDVNELEKKIYATIGELRLRRHSIESSYNDDGEVILSGYVSSEADKEMVTNEISQIPGVTHVENTLTVKEGGNDAVAADATAHTTATIDPQQDIVRKKALLAVKKLPGLGAYEIDLAFTEHAIELTGQAESASDIKKIGQAVQKEAAPFGVVNKISLKALPTDIELIARVQNAFKNEKDLQSEGIVVTAQNGVITLSGEKSNHRIVDRILSIANMVDGVKSVESKIAVK